MDERKLRKIKAGATYFKALRPSHMAYHGLINLVEWNKLMKYCDYLLDDTPEPEQQNLLKEQE